MSRADVAYSRGADLPLRGQPWHRAWPGSAEDGREPLAGDPYAKRTSPWPGGVFGRRGNEACRLRGVRVGMSRVSGGRSDAEGAVR